MNKRTVCGWVLLHKNAVNQPSIVQNGVNRTYFSKNERWWPLFGNNCHKIGRNPFLNKKWNLRASETGRRTAMERTSTWQGRAVCGIINLSICGLCRICAHFLLLPVECVVWRCVWKGKRAGKAGERKRRFRMMRVRARFSFTEWGSCAQWFCVQNSPYYNEIGLSR